MGMLQKNTRKMFLQPRKTFLLCFLRKHSTHNLRNGIYKSVVGLEVHAQISTNSKLFSGAPNNSKAASNTAVALFDASIPGTLPRINKKAVEAAVRTSMALNCHINEISMFDRKHYFYADSPSGFQITQQRLPLAVNGKIEFLVTNTTDLYMKSSRIHQIQLEQDSGRSLHFPEDGVSLLDLNRAGVPLMEIVFEPDLTSGEEAASLLKELSIILTRLGVCSCIGNAMRCDANISIHRPGQPLGIRSEVKNISSFGDVAKAVEFEIARHIDVAERGDRIVNETRSWDSKTNSTISMRDKEVVQDNRFMPEPNLPPLNLAPFDLTALRESLPKMPNDSRSALAPFELHPTLVEVFVRNERLAQLFTEVASEQNKYKAGVIANFLKTTVIAACHRLDISNNECQLTAENLTDIVDLFLNNEITRKAAEAVLFEAVKTPSISAKQFIEDNNMTILRDVVEIREICEECIQKYDKIARKARRDNKGFDKLLSLVFKTSKNRADPKPTAEILKEALLCTSD